MEKLILDEKLEMYSVEYGMDLILADENIPTRELCLPSKSEIDELNHPIKKINIFDYRKSLVDSDISHISNELARLKKKKEKYSDSYTYLNHLATLYDYVGDSKSSLELWEDADKLCDGPMFKHKIGDNLIRSGKVDEAARVFDSLSLENDALANLRLAYLAITVGDICKAATYTSTSLKIDPLGFRANWLAGILAILEGKFAEAITWLRNAIDIKPNIYAVYYNMAIAHTLLDQKHKAVEDLRRAISLNPTHQNSLLFFQSLDVDDGYSSEWYLSSLKTYIKYDSSKGEIWNALAKLYFDRKEYDMAVDSLKKGIRAEGSLIQWNNLGVTYWKMGKSDKALKYFSYVINLGEEKGIVDRDQFFSSEIAQTALVNLCNLLSEVRDFERLLEISDKFIKLAPDNRIFTKPHYSSVYINYVLAIYRTKSKKKAIKDIKRTLQNSEIDGHLKAKLLCQLSFHFSLYEASFEEALSYANEALEIIDNEKLDLSYLKTTLINNITYALIESNQMKDAKRYCTKLYNLVTNDNPLPLATIALFDIRSGKVEQGRKKYEVAIRLSTDSLLHKPLIKKMNLELGNALLKIGDYKNAKRNLIKAKKIDLEENLFNRKIEDLLNEINVLENTNS